MGKPGEYYAKEGAGVWTGQAAQALGLEGNVSQNDFKLLTSGFGRDGVGLVQKAGDPDRRAGWDLTFSAPKSVSVAWSVATPEVRAMIEAAHARACESAFKFMEDKAGFVRTGKDGLVLEKADLVAAAFQHGTSREQDAQLHTHYFVMNVAVREDGRTNAIESANLFDYKMAGGAAYQVAMSSEMQKDGWRIERDGQESFRLVDVPRSLEFEQSTRRQQIEAKLEEKGASGGAAASVAALETRKAKSDIDLPVLREKWTEQAARHGYTADQARPDYRTPEKEKTYELSSYAGAERVGPADQLHQPGLTEAPGLENIATLDGMQELSSGTLDGHKNRSEMLLSSDARHDLDATQPARADRLRWSGDGQAVAPSLQEALAPGRERERPPNVTDVLNKATEHDAIVRDPQIQLAALRASITVQGLDPARALAEKAKGEAVAVERLDGYVSKKGQTYSTDALMRAERAVMAIAHGRAGEDKTVSLEKIQAAIQKAQEIKGYELNTEQKNAVHALCGHQGGVKVMIGDAGTGKSTTMHAVRLAYESAGYRVIGTSTGGAQAAELEKSSGIGSHSIAKLDALLQQGRETLSEKTVLVVDEGGMVDARSMALVMRHTGAAGTKVIVAGDDKQLQSVGPGAPFRYLANKDTGVGHVRLEVNMRQNADWEKIAVKAMSKGDAAIALAAYAQHDKVHITKDYHAAVSAVAERQIQNIDKVGIEKTMAIAGTNAAVLAINEKIREQLQARGELANEHVVLKRSGAIAVAEGERIMIRSPDKQGNFKNGDTGTVKKIDGNTLTMVLDRTGQEVQVNARITDVAHAYAITTNKAQGATYELATIYLTSQTSREMAYVWVSRAKDGTEFVMSSHHLKELMAASPSTPEMRAAVDKVIEARQVAGKVPGITPEAKENYAKAITYLEKNAAYAPAAIKDYTVAEQLRDVARAMSISKPKESTLDYAAVHKQQDHEPRQPQHEGKTMGSKQQEAEIREALNKATNDYIKAMELARYHWEDKQNRTPEQLKEHVTSTKDLFIAAAAKSSKVDGEKAVKDIIQAAPKAMEGLRDAIQAHQRADYRNQAVLAARDYVAARNLADLPMTDKQGRAVNDLQKLAEQMRIVLVDKLVQAHSQDRQEVVQREVKEVPGGKEMANNLERDAQRQEKLNTVKDVLREYKNAPEDERELKAEIAGKEVARLEPEMRQEVLKEAGLSEQERAPVVDEVRRLDNNERDNERDNDNADYYRAVTGDKNYDRNTPRDLDKETAAAEKAVKEYEQFRETIGPDFEDTKITLEIAARAVDDLPTWRQAEVLEKFPEGTRQEIGDAIKDLDKDKEHGGKAVEPDFDYGP